MKRDRDKKRERKRENKNKILKTNKGKERERKRAILSSTHNFIIEFCGRFFFLLSLSLCSISWAFSWAYNLWHTAARKEKPCDNVHDLMCVCVYVCIYLYNGRMMWPSPAPTQLWLMRSKIGNVDLVAWIYDKENECFEHHKIPPAHICQGHKCESLQIKLHEQHNSTTI